jgi:hypothetical protein
MKILKETPVGYESLLFKILQHNEDIKRDTGGSTYLRQVMNPFCSFFPFFISFFLQRERDGEWI